MTLNKIHSNFPENLLCKNSYGTFFGVNQKVLDEVWGQLMDPGGNSIAYISMEIGADLDVFDPVADYLIRNKISNSKNKQVQIHIDRHLKGPQKIPNYSGGLGILAGDTLKSFSDNHIPVFAISLLYREGYFSQLVDSQLGQIDHATNWEPPETPSIFQLHEPDNQEKPLEIKVLFHNEYNQIVEARAQVWMKLEINEAMDFFVPEFLIDYSIPSSPDWIRETGKRLYNSKSTIMKANQRRLLGSGILPLMEKLGLMANTIHLNEQHGVTVTLHLILRELEKKFGPDFEGKMDDRDIIKAVDNVSQRIVYTIHTPVKAGHDRFPKSLYSSISHKTSQRILNLLARDDDSPHDYNFTAMAMRINRSINSVSRLHRDVTRIQFPQFADKIKAITNGVHHITWISKNRADAFDSHKELKEWRHDPGTFARANLIKKKSFRHDLNIAWEKDNIILIEHINSMLIEHRKQMMTTWIDPPNYLSHLNENNNLEPGVFTIGFARRFSTYKRADLIFEDIQNLADILLQGGWRINFVFAGKAHPEDEPGKTVLKLILDNQKELFIKSNGLAKLVFIPGYDMHIAKMMTSGVHAWLNNPKRPLEASGTSGMKAAMNGVPNISVMDGWWVEGYHNGTTGWKFGYEGPVEESSLSEEQDSLFYEEDSHSFYNLLPSILECYYKHFDEYLDKAIMNLQANVPIFNTHRMAAEYVEKYNLKLKPSVEENINKFQQLYQSEQKTVKSNTNP